MVETLARACDGCLNGEFAALITGPVHKGVINDAGIPFTGHTEFFEERSQAKKVVMMLATEELRVALATTHLPLRDIADAINSHAQANGYSVVEEIGGHGVGLEFHEEPWVSYVAPKGTEMLLVPGMIFTIEPMINEGSPDFFVDEDNGWTVYTEDDGLSAQVEYMVLITEDGCEVLTK